MNTTSIGSLMGPYQPQRINNINGNSSQDRDGDGDNEHSKVNGKNAQGGAFFQNVLQALQSLGISLPVSQSSNTNRTDTQTNSNNTGGISPEVRKALHQFMHDLHHALKPNAGTPDGNLSTAPNAGNSPGKGLLDFSTDLQSLIASLGSTSSSTSNDATSPLKTDFSNLLQALGGSSEPGQGPSLTDFLTQLQQKFAANGDTGSGAIVNTTA